MIDQLYIENVALIEKIELSFSERLNILSGETGAGKSMIIDAINFLLGERSGRDFIRRTAEQATVTGIVRLADCSVTEALGIEGDCIQLSRSVNTQGKSVCRINGKVVTLGMLKEISAYMADFHGQHEHQSLLNPSKHILLLDRFCGTELEKLKDELSGHILHYKEVAGKISALAGDKNREAQLEILRFRRDELEEAKLKPGEEDELLQRREVLGASEKLAESAGKACAALYDGEQPALDNVFRAKTAAAEIARLDSEQSALAEGLAEAYSQLEELARDLRRYFDSLEHDPNELERTETRLDLIYMLKRKYAPGGTIEDLLGVYHETAEKLAFYENSEEDIKRLTLEKRECTGDILKTCEEISKLRKKAAAEICSRITDCLHELGMRHAEFEIALERKKEFSSGGYDRVEFLISPNPGEGLKPLAKIASGGEMSRIMLAIKTVLADSDNIETFVFDEIDAGVSGRTAQKVAEKLVLIAKNRQILCITHLPQIAAMADRHFLIEKHSDGTRTATSVTELDATAAVAELARLLGGARITEATVKAAREMRELAMQMKNELGGFL